MKIEEARIKWDGEPVSLKGNISNYKKKPELDLNITGNVHLSRLLRQINIDNAKGICEINGNIQGNIKDIMISGDVSVDSGSISDYKIEQLNAFIDYRDNKINFSSSSVRLAGGKLIWGGNWERSGNINIRGKAQGMSASEITGIDRITGGISGDLTVGGSVEFPEIDIEVAIDELNFPEKGLGHVVLKGSYRKPEISFDGFTMDGKYSVDGKLVLVSKEKSLEIAKFEVSGMEKGRIVVEGGIKYSPMEANLYLRAIDIEVEDIYQLKKMYPRSKGDMDFEGRIRISPKKFKASGKLVSDNFSLNEESYSLFCNLEASSEKELGKFSITDINVNDYLKGFLELEKNGKTMTVKRSSFSAESADIKQLVNLTKKDMKIESGKLNGSLYIDNHAGWTDFVIDELYAGGIDLGRVDCSLKYDQKDWKAEKIEFKKGDGKVVASGNIYPMQAIAAKFSDFELKGRKIEGNGNFTGSLTEKNKAKKYDFVVDVKELALNSKKWPQVTAKGNYEGKELSVKIKAGDKIKGELNSVKGGKVESDIWINKFEIEKILDILNKKIDIKGLMTGSLKILGNTGAPLLIFEGSLDNVELYKMPLSGKGQLEYQAGRVKVNKFKGSITDTGYFTAKGSIDDDIINASAEIEKLNIAMLKRNFKGIKNMGGVLNIKLGFMGSVQEPIVELVGDGKDILINKFALDNIDLKVRYFKNKLFLKNIEAAYKNRIINLSEGEVELSENGEPLVNVTGYFKNIILGPLTVFGRANISGKMRFDPFYCKLKIHPQNLLINRLNLKSVMNVTYTKRFIDFEVDDGIKTKIYADPDGGIQISYLDMKKKDKLIVGSGNYRRGDFNGDFQFQNIEINKLVRLLDSSQDLYGISTFRAKVNKSTEGFSAQGIIRLKSGSYKAVKIEDMGCDFQYDKGVLEVKDTYIRNPDMLDLEVEGKVGKDSNIRVIINRLSLSILKDMSSEISEAAGYFKGDFRMRGSLDDPRISGEMDLEKGSIEGKDIIGKIKDITCRIKADKSKLVFKEVKAYWKPGIINVKGYVDFAKRPLGIKLDIETEGKRGVAVKIPYLDIPQSTIFGRYLTLPSHGEPQGKISVYSSEDKYHIAGDVILNNTHFTYPPAKGSKDTPETSILDNAVLDINLNSGESVWYENTTARVKITGKLNFKKYPGKEIIINGELTSNQGEVTYFNRDFSVREARLKFEDTVEYLTAIAATDIHRKTDGGEWVDDMMVMEIPTGRIADVVPNFSSSKFTERTSSEEALELAIAGVDFESLNQSQRNALLRRELLRAIDANLTSPLVKNILKRTELIDTAKVDVKVSENVQDDSMVLEGAGLRVGRHVTDRLYMGYYMEFGTGIENKLRLSHELDMLYRLQGSQFLRGRVSKEEKFLGIEQQIRF